MPEDVIDSLTNPEFGSFVLRNCARSETDFRDSLHRDRNPVLTGRAADCHDDWNIAR